MYDLFDEPPKPKKESRTDKAVKSVKQWLGWLSVLAVTAVYIVSGFFTITSTGKTIWDILAKMAVTLTIGVVITRGWARQGLIAGLKDSIYIEAKEEHRNAVESSRDYLEYSDEWAELENEISLREDRKAILSEVGLSYKKFFDAKGEFIGSYFPVNKELDKETVKLNKFRNEKIKKALQHRVTPVMINNLMTVGGKNILDRNKISPDARALDKRSLVRETLSKILTAIIFGIWTLENVTNPAQITQTLLEVLTFQAGGALAYYSRYLFRTEDEVAVFKEKTNLLRRLIRYGELKKEEIKNGNFNSTKFSPTEGETLRTDSQRFQTTSSTSIPTSDGRVEESITEPTFANESK